MYPDFKATDQDRANADSNGSRFLIKRTTKLNTECPKIYRKSVLHLLKYNVNLYLNICSTDLRYILGH